MTSGMSVPVEPPRDTAGGIPALCTGATRLRLGDPVVSAEEASAPVHDLRRRLEVGRLLFGNPEDFHDEYPLEYRDERIVRRGIGEDDHA